MKFGACAVAISWYKENSQWHLMFQEFVQKLFFKFNFEIDTAAIDDFNGFTHFMLNHCLYNNFEF